MKLINYISLSLTAFFLGILLLSLHKNWIIIRLPIKTQIKQVKHVNKKTVKLIYWDRKWDKEELELIWSDDISQNLHYLINTWLTLLDEEKVMSKKVSLQSALLSNKDAYLSFDRNPFNPEDSTFEKWMWVEGLLKTIKQNDIILQNVYLLTHHQTIIDDHLDFSRPWPITGFLKESL